MTVLSDIIARDAARPTPSMPRSPASRSPTRNASSQAPLRISCDSPAEVDRITESASGQRQDRRLAGGLDQGGPMYGSISKTLMGTNGSRCGMDRLRRKAAHPVEESVRRRNHQEFRREFNAARSKCSDRDHRAQLGSCFAQGLVTDLRSAGRSKRPVSTIASACSAGERPPEYPKEQPFNQVPCFSDGDCPDFRKRRDPPIYRRTERSAAAARPAGQVPRDPVDLCGGQQRRAVRSSRAAARRPLHRRGLGRSGQAGAEDFARLRLKRVSDWLGDKDWLEGDRFTIGDLMMVTRLAYSLGTPTWLADFPNLAAL